MSYLYNPSAKFPFKISRSKIDLFYECPRCFYLDRRLGVSRPGMPSFTLNSAVDLLLKNEFDLLRKKGRPHDLMTRYKIDAVPFQHPEINEWRVNFTGKQFHHKKTKFIIFGAVDDIWVNPKEELHIVDYKSTSTDREISLNDEYKEGYKRQMEIYQWIFRQGGFNVSKMGYFVFANAEKNRDKFDGRLEFELSIIGYEGDDSWVEPTIFEIKKCLDADKIPGPGANCKYCHYRENAVKYTKDDCQPLLL